MDTAMNSSIESEPTNSAQSVASNRGDANHGRSVGGGQGHAISSIDSSAAQSQSNDMSTSRASRPGAVRAPSNAYAPMRRPAQHSIKTNSSRRGTSSLNWNRRNPNADYRAQERAYVERIRQGLAEDDEYLVDSRTPSLYYSTDSEDDDESSSNLDQLDNDEFDQDTLLYYGNDEMQPSVEELKIPENREIRMALYARKCFDGGCSEAREEALDWWCGATRREFIEN